MQKKVYQTPPKSFAIDYLFYGFAELYGAPWRIFLSVFLPLTDGDVGLSVC